MQWELFFSALALMLIFEGMLPFLNPRRWRLVILQILQMDDRTIRKFGFFSMMMGVLVLSVI